MRDVDVIDSDPRLIPALRQAARERGRPVQSVVFADELLGERRKTQDATS
jgi:hypothetical protein